MKNPTNVKTLAIDDPRTSYEDLKFHITEIFNYKIICHIPLYNLYNQHLINTRLWNARRVTV